MQIAVAVSIPLSAPDSFWLDSISSARLELTLKRPPLSNEQLAERMKLKKEKIERKGEQNFLFS